MAAATDLSCQLACLDLGDETARSAGMLPIPLPIHKRSTGSSGMGVGQQQQQQQQQLQWVLGVGTNSGLLLLWEVTAAAAAAPSTAGVPGTATSPLPQQWLLSGGAAVRISNVAVELSLMPEPPSRTSYMAADADAPPTPTHMLYAHSGSDAVVRVQRALSATSAAGGAAAAAGAGKGGAGYVKLVGLVRTVYIHRI